MKDRLYIPVCAPPWPAIQSEADYLKTLDDNINRWRDAVRLNKNAYDLSVTRVKELEKFRDELKKVSY